MHPPLKIIFAGTPDFSATALQALLNSSHQVIAVYTQPDRPAGRGRQLSASPVKQLAVAQGIPVYQPVTLRDAVEQEKLNNLNADIMVVVAYGLLLPLPVLSAPKYGCINIHASLLPKWRGAAPIQRAVLAGDAETGITIMQMDEGLDTGDMLHCVTCPIEMDDTSETLYERLAGLGAEAMLFTLNKIACGELQREEQQFVSGLQVITENGAFLNPEKQDNALATYAHKIKKEEAHINWQATAEELARLVRAFNPWPIAYTLCGEQTVRVWQAQAVPSLGSAHTPGTILQMSADGIIVATSNGGLSLQQLQFPGGKIISAADVCNSNRQDFLVGTVLR